MEEDLDQRILGTKGEKPSWIQWLPFIGYVKWRNDLWAGRPAIGRDKWVLDETTGRYAVRDSFSIKSLAWGLYQGSIMSASVMSATLYAAYQISQLID